MVVLNYPDFSLQALSHRQVDLHYKEVNTVDLDLHSYSCLWICNYTLKYLLFYIIKTTLVSGVYINVICKISSEQKIQKKFEDTKRGQVRLAEGSGYKAASWQSLFQGQPEAAEPSGLCPSASLGHHSVESQSTST